MRLEKTAAIAEIVSSLAIVVTLAFLTMQTREMAMQTEQTNELLIGGSRQAALAADLALFNLGATNPEVTARILGLSAEQVQENSVLNIILRAREYQWFQYRSGTLDRTTFDSYMRPVRTFLQSEIGADYWARSQGAYDPEFAQFINELLVEPRGR